jgi:multiple sugar transport system substrate-binding protein
VAREPVEREKEDLKMGEYDHDDVLGLEPIDRRTLLERAALAGGALAAGGLLAERAGAAPMQAPGNVTFVSTQLNPVPEQEAFRNVLLQGFRGRVEAIFPATDAAFENRVRAEAQAGRGSIDLLGALHGSFVTLRESVPLLDLSDIARDFTRGRSAINPEYMRLGRLGTNRQLYIPWMQATYVMAANKDVIRYLPRGARATRLTYAQLLQWARNIERGVGRERLGFPAGTNGLIHRFFQGYLVPAFSGGVVTTFKSAGAANGWNYMRSLWDSVHPQSVAYDFMQDPMLSEEVLLVWEHVARMKTALERRPDDFVAFPAPTGPRGLAYMPVLAGFAIPRNAPNPNGAKALIRHLLSLSVQARTLSAVGFFPVVGGRLSRRISAGLRLESNAVKLQQQAPKALPSLLPIGLGAESGNFNRVYRDTFTRVVVRKEDTNRVLAEQAAALQAIMDKTGAPCWRPDPPSRGACRVR